VVNILPRKSLAALGYLLILGCPSVARADKLEDAVRALAGRVLPMVQGNKPACVDWDNRSAISDMRSLALRSMFLLELGIQQSGPGASSGSCAINVVVDRTPTQIVLVVSIGSGEQKRVLMSEVSRSDAGTPAATRPAARLQRELLIQQGGRILDALEIEGMHGEAASLLVLTRDAVAIYQPESGSWDLKSLQALPNSTANQRAPRGELRWNAGSPDALQVLFAGESCTININQTRTVNCQPSAEPWREAALSAVSCGQGPLSLRPGTGDWSEPDHIQLVNPLLPPDQAPLAQIDLPGPVLSMAPGTLPDVFAAVVFNLSTENYEVYRITLVCGN
jgi:hypothetical protein